jgi:spermidine synthase
MEVFVMSGDRYFDPWTRNTHLTYTVLERYESFESPFQTIEVFRAADFGNVLSLGGVTNVTDRDESGYHEMLAHVPMLHHPCPKRVLIIGGGDGGTLGEVLKHPEVEEAVLVDIDGEVIRVSRQYFPRLASAMDHPKAKVIVGDGLAYVEEAAARGETFDVILVDSTDPVDAAVELFTEKFYRQCAALLGEGGILVPQSDSPVFYMDRVCGVVETLGRCFANVHLYMGQVIAYPGGTWAYTMASQQVRPGAAADPARVAALGDELRYFNEGIFQAAFAVPTYVSRALQGGRVALPSICDDPTR